MVWLPIVLLIPLQAVQEDPSAQVRSLILKLRSEAAREREDAERRLRAWGQTAVPDLEIAAKDSDPEVAARAGSLLREIFVEGYLTPAIAKHIPGVVARLSGGDSHAWTEVYLEATSAQPLRYPGVPTADLDRVVARAVKGARTAAERKTICEAAARCAHRSIEPEIPRLLADPDSSVRAASAYAVQVLRLAGCAKAVHPLLKDKDPQARMWAIAALGAVDAREYAPNLIALLQDDRVGYAAAEALGKLKCKEAIPAIRALLKQDDLSLQHAAVRALMELEAKEAADDVLALIDDPRGANWSISLIGYSRLLGTGASRKLIALLNDPGRHVLIRSEAARHLGDLKAVDAVSSFVSLLRSPVKPLQHYSVHGLLKCGAELAGPKVLPLLERADPQLRWGALAACRLLKIEGGLEQSCHLLGDPDPEIREQAAQTVATIGGAAVAGRLLPLLKDPVRSVRVRTASELCQLGRIEGAPVLLEESPSLSTINGLRQPAEWSRLRAVPLAQLGGDRKDLIRCLALNAERPFEWPEQMPPELVTWSLRGVVILQSGDRMDWVTGLDRSLDGKLEVIVESDRLRVVPRAEALKFWRDWCDAQKGK